MSAFLESLKTCGFLPTLSDSADLDDLFCAIADRGVETVELPENGRIRAMKSLRPEMKIAVRAGSEGECADAWNAGADAILALRETAAEFCRREKLPFIAVGFDAEGAEAVMCGDADAVSAKPKILCVRDVPKGVFRDRKDAAAICCPINAAGDIPAIIDSILDLRFVHIGINSGDLESDAVGFCRLLGCERKSGATSDMCGTLIELMKVGGRGTHGHLGFSTPDLLRAIHYLERRGFSVSPEDIRYDPCGHAYFAYFSELIAGFAFHIMEA